MGTVAAVIRATRRFRAGTVTCFNRHHKLRLNVRLEVGEREGRGDVYRMVLHDGKTVFELWECTSLHTLKKIATGYYPELCRAFGPARLYVGY